MKAIIVLLLICVSATVFGQTAEQLLAACKIYKPVSAIKEGRARRRVNTFLNRKNVALDSMIHKSEIPAIAYSKKTFIKLLDKLTAEKEYDGFRIYLATYPNMPPIAGTPDSGNINITKGASDCFTLIFVPTKGKDDIHIDQISNCYFIKDDTVKSADANTDKFIRQWLAKYKQQRAPYFSIDATGRLNKGVISLFPRQQILMETESLWYKKTDMKNDSTGLYDFINCGDNGVDQVSVLFAGYLQKHLSYSYHLSLVFKIQSIVQSRLPDKSGKRVLKERLVTYDTKATTDTGKPCPPPKGGCPLEGAILPNP